MEGDEIVRRWRQACATTRPDTYSTPYGVVLVVSVQCGGPDPVWLAGPFRMEDGSSTIAAFDSQEQVLEVLARYLRF